MDRLEQYLESVRRSLDVRNKVEQEEIVVEIRDHILTLAEQLESDGHEPEKAIEEAIAHMGDGLLVASRVSEAHDGGSWRQAWVAALPFALSGAISATAAWFGHPATGWPFWVAEIVVLVVLYVWLSPNVPGRRWKMSWLASTMGCAVALAAVLSYNALAPKSLGSIDTGAAQVSISPPFDVSDTDIPLIGWLASFASWTSFAIASTMAGAMSVLLLKRRRYTHALLTLLPAAFALLVLLRVGSNAGDWLFPLMMLYAFCLLLILLYLVVIEQLNGDWTMCWCFYLGLAPPIVQLLSGGDWAAVVRGLAVLLPVGGTVLFYTSLPRKRAVLVFLLGIIAGDIIRMAGLYITGPRPDAVQIGELVWVFSVFYIFLKPYDRLFHGNNQPNSPLGYQ